jgi:putative Mg2+ transporter-C (MgtC) family protein
MMPQHYIDIAGHLAAAWIAGSLIGLERSYHGRPAGFRTHAIVCLASAMLMLVTAYQSIWLELAPIEKVQTDPTRIAQGIMTGIGFLEAGAIFKEGLTVRGLTTAASIWMTAALGILYGVGLFWPAVLGTVATLGTLTFFRHIEAWAPSEIFALHVLRFSKDRVMEESEVRRIISEQGFSIANMSYRLNDEGKTFEYRMTIRTLRQENIGRLADLLRRIPEVLEFRVSPTGD